MVWGGVAVIVLAFFYKVWRRQMRRRRERFIDEYAFHPGIVEKFREVRPGLSEAQEELFAVLRDYFHLCNSAGRRMVAMPSQVVDDAWHAFILFTRLYQQFSQHAFGRFLHHTPTTAMKSPILAGEGIKRAWRLACAREGIDPRNPATLPFIFAIDAELGISNGFFYTPDCMANPTRPDGSSNYCGAHIGCSSGCSGDSGGGDASGCGGDSGCGGGCGGD